MKTTTIIKTVLIASLVVWAPKVAGICQQTFWALRTFSLVNYDFSRLRDLDPIYASAKEMRRILPDRSKVGIPEADPITRAKLKYALYPMTVDRNWEYYLDFGKRENGLNAAIERAQGFRLSTGMTIYAKQGHSFVYNERYSRPYPVVKAMFLFFAVTVLNLLVGIAILTLLNIRCVDGGKSWYLGAGYLLGFFVLTFGLWIFLMLGGGLNKITVTALWAIIFLILMFPRAKSFSAHLKDLISLKGIKFAVPKGLFYQCLAVLAIVLLVVVFLSIFFTPVLFWDSLTNWILKAKGFFYHGKLVLEQTYRNEYPILWPLNIAAQFALLGNDFDHMAKWTVGCLFLAFLSQLIGALCFLRVPSKFIGIILFVWVASFYHESVGWAYAETGFLAFFAGILAALLAWLKFREQKFFILGFFLAIGLAAMKLEGAITSLCIGLALVLASVQRPWQKKKAWKIVLALMIPFGIEMLWIVWIKTAGYVLGSTHFQGGFSFEKMSATAQAIKDFLLSPGNIAPGLPYFILLAILFFKKKRLNTAEMFLLILATFLILFCGVSHVGNSVKIILEYSRFSIDRLFLHATPALILLMGSLMSRTIDE